MNQDIQQYLSKYPDEIRALFAQLAALLPQDAEGRLWARLPSFYRGERFVRLIPFKDHINVEAAAMLAHQARLHGCALTPKGMLQLKPGRVVPEDELRAIFEETLNG